MQWGIITLTKGGLELAKELKVKLPGSVIFTLKKWNYKDGGVIEGKFEDFIGRIFNQYKVMIFIMAAGIVVRSISRFIKDKTTDPAVLVIDEKGKFVISLLSGHIGGANEAANIVANIIGAEPVITTSSDLNDRISVDMLALELNCRIDDMNRAKQITSMIVNREDVAIVSDIDVEIPGYFIDNPDNAKGIIYITNRKILNRKNPYVRLIPGNIVIGVGCRKGTEKKRVIDLINNKLNEFHIDKRSIKCLCSVEIKKDEIALREAADYFKTELRFMTVEDIKSVEEKFKISEFVREKIGVGAVSEPCAFLASNGSGKMIMGKQKSVGVTAAFWEENSPATWRHSTQHS